MTALTDNRPHDAVALGAIREIQLGAKATYKLYEGAMICPLNADGYAVPAGTAGTGAVAGVAEAACDNSYTGATDGGLSVNLLQGAFWRMNSGSNAVTAANVLDPVYAEDDQTISSDPADGPLAGVCLGVDATLGVLVMIGPYNEAIQQILSSELSASKMANVSMGGLYEVDGTALAAFSDGVSTTPGFALDNAKAAGVRWNNDAAPDPVCVALPIPADLDATSDVVVHVAASKSGNTLADATTFDVEAFFNVVGALADADADAGGTTDAMVGDAAAKTVQEVTVTIAAADVSAAPGTLTLTIQPTDGTIGTDDVTIHGIWLEYTGALLGG